MRYEKGKAFTLVELLVVIAIIGLLSTLSLVAVVYARGAARKAKAQHDIESIMLAVKQLETDSLQWPGHQAVDALNTVGANEVWDLNSPEAGLVTTDGNFPNWNGPYMAVIRLDPWGNPYFLDTDYLVNGENKVVIGSFGPNGIGQNVYDADNIIKILR